MQATAGKRSCFCQQQAQQQQQQAQQQVGATHDTRVAPVAEMLESLRAMGGSCAEELLAFLELQSALLQVGVGGWRVGRRGEQEMYGCSTLEDHPAPAQAPI